MKSEEWETEEETECKASIAEGQLIAAMRRYRLDAAGLDELVEVGRRVDDILERKSRGLFGLSDREDAIHKRFRAALPKEDW